MLDELLSRSVLTVARKSALAPGVALRILIVTVTTPRPASKEGESQGGCFVSPVRLL